jgi:hypothetical protein
MFDEIETGFLLINEFTEERLRPPQRRKSNAELAAMVGLKEHPKLTQKPPVSEAKCMGIIK